MILYPFTPAYTAHQERLARWKKIRQKPPESKPCPECKSKMSPWSSGGGLHIGYKCNPCGFGGNGRPYGVDGITPAMNGLNPCGIIEETWAWQIEQRKKAEENGKDVLHNG